MVKECELYHAVTPGELEGNGCSCLTGEMGAMEVDGGMRTEGVYGPKFECLNGCLSTHTGKGAEKSLTARGDGSKTCVLLPVSQ